ncbi:MULTISPECIES: hypothetical protein [unclassified Kribbella]|uniref:hypothetical protein n=1 Tax=unclassified Kribbella TaxID=2644121 RepID=UPI0030174B6B
MLRFVVRLGAVLVLGAASVLGVGAIAGADPGGSPRSFEVLLVCDNGESYELILNGNGEFAVGHDSASDSIIVPTAFGPFHGVLTDAAGNVVDEFTDPAVAKGNSTKDRGTSTECTFEFDETFTDPVLGVLHFHGEGTATVFVTPAN